MKEEAKPPRSEVTGISLRLSHPQPRELGEMLRGWGHSVGHEWRAGDPRVTRKGKTVEGVQPTSYAYTNLVRRVPDTLSAALKRIIDELQPIESELQAFTSDGGRAELFVHWHFNDNSGDTLDWRLLQKLSESRLDLALDIYPDADWLEGIVVDTNDETPGTQNGKGRSHAQT